VGFWRKRKATTQELGRGLAELHLGSTNPVESAEYLSSIAITNLSVDEPRLSLGLAAMYMVSFTRVAQSDAVPMEPAALQATYEHLRFAVAAGALTRYHPESDLSELAAILSSATSELLQVWNENLDGSPSPYWHVAKRLCADIMGPTGANEVVCVTYLSSMMSRNTDSILEVLREVGEKYGVQL